MRRKLFIMAAIMTLATALWCNSAFAVSITVDGYTANGTSSISQSSQYAAVVGSGVTSYPITNSSCTVSTVMRYYEYHLLDSSAYLHTEYASDSSSNGQTAVAICRSSTGDVLCYYSPDVETSTHTVSHNGVTHSFQSNSN